MIPVAAIPFGACGATSGFNGGMQGLAARHENGLDLDLPIGSGAAPAGADVRADHLVDGIRGLREQGQEQLSLALRLPASSAQSSQRRVGGQLEHLAAASQVSKIPSKRIPAKLHRGRMPPHCPRLALPGAMGP